MKTSRREQDSVFCDSFVFFASVPEYHDEDFLHLILQQSSYI
jgi:hypothetical protein